MRLTIQAATIFTVFGFFVVQVVPQSCPNGFMRHDPSCYALICVLASWSEARGYCAEIDVHLVIVETEAEITIW